MSDLVTIYRVGRVEVGNHSAGLLHRWGAVDAHKPAEHPTGRCQAIYASPNLYGLERWLSASLQDMKISELEVHAIEVDPEQVYAYYISHYEQLEDLYDEDEIRDAIENFWNTGATLAEWMEYGEPESGDDIEILLGAENVLSTRQIGHTELVDMMTAHGMHKTGLDHLRRSADDFKTAA